MCSTQNIDNYSLEDYENNYDDNPFINRFINEEGNVCDITNIEQGDNKPQELENVKCQPYQGGNTSTCPTTQGIIDPQGVGETKEDDEKVTFEESSGQLEQADTLEMSNPQQQKQKSELKINKDMDEVNNMHQQLEPSTDGHQPIIQTDAELQKEKKGAVD